MKPSGPRRRRLIRSAIHVAVSVAAASVLALLDAVPAALVLVAATAAALGVEATRRFNPDAAAAFERTVGGLLKEEERLGLTGATTLSIGFTISAALMPGGPALVGVLLAGLADPAAGLVGSRFGRRRYPGGKSVIGSTAFFVVGLTAAVALGLGAVEALLVAAITTAVEAPALGVDDNLYLPPVAAAATVLAGWVTPM